MSYCIRGSGSQHTKGNASTYAYTLSMNSLLSFSPLSLSLCNTHTQTCLFYIHRSPAIHSYYHLPQFLASTKQVQYTVSRSVHEHMHARTRTHTQASTVCSTVVVCTSGWYFSSTCVIKQLRKMFSFSTLLPPVVHSCLPFLTPQTVK